MRFWFVTIFIALGASAQDAKQQYQARCAACQGEDGTGGGHGPTKVETSRPFRAPTREAIRNLILNGTPDAGMPAFRIPETQADAIAAYVVTLRQPAATENTAVGDVGAGERLFSERQCATCHMIRGRGGIVGPDLSTVGRDRTAQQIEQALRDPGNVPARRGAPAWRAVTVRLRDGQSLRGIAKNESAFGLQLLSVDGKLHLLSKDRIAEIGREKTLMPKVEAPAPEFRNLVAYLSSLKSIGVATGELGAGVPFSDIARPKAGAWPTYHGNVSGNRFSQLDQINRRNVAQLAPKWMFTFPNSTRALEMTPVVVDGVMYVTAVNEA